MSGLTAPSQPASTHIGTPPRSICRLVSKFKELKPKRKNNVQLLLQTMILTAKQFNILNIPSALYGVLQTEHLAEANEP